MVKETAIYSYHEILVSNRKVITDTYNILNESPRIRLSEKKESYLIPFMQHLKNISLEIENRLIMVWVYGQP